MYLGQCVKRHPLGVDWGWMADPTTCRLTRKHYACSRPSCNQGNFCLSFEQKLRKVRSNDRRDWLGLLSHCHWGSLNNIALNCESMWLHRLKYCRNCTNCNFVTGESVEGDKRVTGLNLSTLTNILAHYARLVWRRVKLIHICVTWFSPLFGRGTSRLSALGSETKDSNCRVQTI